MNRLGVFLGWWLTTLTTLGGNAVAAPKTPSPAESGLTGRQILIFERTGCFGECPSYQVEVDDDGMVAYEGRAHVLKKGKAAAKLDGEALSALRQVLARLDTVSRVLDRECIEGYTDDFSIVIAFRGAKPARRIRDYQGCTRMKGDDNHDLKELRRLERKIELILKIERWVGTPIEAGGRSTPGRR